MLGKKWQRGEEEWGWGGGRCARVISSRQRKKGRLISRTKLQAGVYDILSPTTAIVDYAVGLEKLSANEQFFWSCSNGSIFVTDNSNKSDVSLQTTLLTQVQIKPKSFESRRNFFLSFFFFTRGGCVSCLRRCLGAMLLPQSY